MSNIAVKVRIANAARRISAHVDAGEYLEADLVTAEEINTLPRDYLTVMVFVLFQLPMGKHSFKDLMVILSLIDAGLAVNCVDGNVRPTRLGRYVQEAIVRTRTSDWRPESA